MALKWAKGYWQASARDCGHKSGPHSVPRTLLRFPKMNPFAPHGNKLDEAGGAMSPSSRGRSQESGCVRDDIRLAQRMAQGDPEAYGEFLDAYGGRIHALARRYAQTSTDAEDLTQEVSIQILRSIKSYRGDSALATWVFRVTLNLCLRHARKKRLAVTDFEEAALSLRDERRSSDPSGETARKELSGRVHAALLRLSPLHREVVVLHELEGMTYQECAERLNVPVGTVKSRLSNAFTRLRATLGGYVLGDEMCAETIGETVG